MQQIVFFDDKPFRTINEPIVTEVDRGLANECPKTAHVTREGRVQVIGVRRGEAGLMVLCCSLKDASKQCYLGINHLKNLDSEERASLIRKVARRNGSVSTRNAGSA